MNAPPKRRFRNYLLDPGFQLKYTSMVVGVTLIVASVLGYFAYSFSHQQTELLSMSLDTFDPSAAADIEGWMAERDRMVLLSIVGGITFLTFALALTGIIVTHKVVGPVYKMRLLLGKVADGHLKLQGRLRKGDELQELFESFATMVESLRTAQQEEIDELDLALNKARDAGANEDVLEHIIAVRDRMKAALD